MPLFYTPFPLFSVFVFPLPVFFLLDEIFMLPSSPFFNSILWDRKRKEILLQMSCDQPCFHQGHPPPVSLLMHSRISRWIVWPCTRIFALVDDWECVCVCV